MEFLNHITERAKVAFYLAVAEKVFEGIEKNDDNYSMGREALDKAWDWLEGKKTSGHELHQYLENERDNGLIVISSEIEDEPTKESIWLTVTNSLAYTIWKAYIFDNDFPLPQTIEEINEAVVDLLVEFSEKCPNIDKESMKRIGDYLLEKYQTNAPGKFGDPITKKEIMNILK